jgi:N-acylneuraminate cytidylyltransferase
VHSAFIFLNNMNNKPFSVLCVIPARGGSKGVPRKNIRPLGGRPLIAYTIEAAKESGAINRLVVSTEDPEIAEVAGTYGAEVIERPVELATDKALTEPVMLHALEAVEQKGFYPTHIALIQCTSPLLSAGVIRDAVATVRSGAADSCITVFYPQGYEFKWTKGRDGFFLPEHDVESRPRRQDLNLPYHENGAFYITSTALFKKTGNRFGGSHAHVAAVEMSEADSIQIDSEDHFFLAEQLFRRRIAQG